MISQKWEAEKKRLSRRNKGISGETDYGVVRARFFVPLGGNRIGIHFRLPNAANYCHRFYDGKTAPVTELWLFFRELLLH